MGVATFDPKVAPGAGNDEGETSKRGGRLWILSAIVAGAAVLAGFYGIDAYSAGTSAAVTTTNNNSNGFETVFRDLLKRPLPRHGPGSRGDAAGPHHDGGFRPQDCPALVARIEPFFDQLSKHHSVEQLNFWLPPAKLYYRAGRPNDFGADVSKYRRTIVAANERQQPVIAVETGTAAGRCPCHRAGHVDGKFVGALEFASNFDVPLERASATAEMKWAMGVTREVSERVERPADSRSTSGRRTTSSILLRPATAQLLRSISFDPQPRTNVATNGRHTRSSCAPSR